MAPCMSARICNLVDRVATANGRFPDKLQESASGIEMSWFFVVGFFCHFCRGTHLCASENSVHYQMVLDVPVIYNNSKLIH